MRLEPMVVQMAVAESEQQINMMVEGDESVPFNVDAEIRTVNTDGFRGYAELPDKPCINEHELRAGENTLEEIMARMTFAEVDQLFR